MVEDTIAPGEPVEGADEVAGGSPSATELAEQARVADALEEKKDAPKEPEEVKGSTKGVLKGAEADAARAADEAKLHPETVEVPEPVSETELAEEAAEEKAAKDK